MHQPYLQSRNNYTDERHGKKSYGKLRCELKKVFPKEVNRVKRSENVKQMYIKDVDAFGYFTESTLFFS